MATRKPAAVYNAPAIDLRASVVGATHSEAIDANRDKFIAALSMSIDDVPNRVWYGLTKGQAVRVYLDVPKRITTAWKKPGLPDAAPYFYVLTSKYMQEPSFLAALQSKVESKHIDIKHINFQDSQDAVGMHRVRVTALDTRS